MEETYDVAIIGGAFSGAATAIMLKRDRPELRIIIVERSEHFDRKVGEATTEMSGCFLTKVLGLNHHLNQQHIAKYGLRFWFNKTAADSFGDCGEVGPYFQTRMPSFQVDREILDEHILSVAVAEGVALLRPAKVNPLEIAAGKSTLSVTANGAEHQITARWVVDASGRAAVLARKFDLLRPLPAHPTNSIWARFRGVKDWDSIDLRKRFPDYAKTCQVSRATATNHLTGYGWWVWIIPLKGGDYSAGLTYDARLFTPPAGASLGERLKAHLVENPVGREIFGDAEFIEGDVKAYSTLPYYAEKIAGPGWQLVGDASGFMDPLYSQGLDFCAWTATAAVNRITAELDGQPCSLDEVNRRWMKSYHTWFNALYKDKYYYLGDQELYTVAFMFDLGLFFFGPVSAVVKCLKSGYGHFPFSGPVDGLVGKFMAFYNRRLAIIAQKRMAAGVYGASNLGTRTLVPGFEPNVKALKMVRRGFWLWLKAELRSAFLPAPKMQPVPLPQTTPALS